MCSPNRTLVIPGGTLDGSVTNVVTIPYQLEDPNIPLVVRAPALDRSAPIQGPRGFFMWGEDQRMATSLDGPRATRRSPDRYDEFDDMPVGVSTPQSYLDDDYYYDMYDSDEDRFVGGESGNLSGSVMERIMAGELNQVEGVAPPLPPRPRTPLEESSLSFHNSTVSSSGYEGSVEPHVPSHYTPYSPSIPHYSYEGEYGAPEPEPMPVPNCGPCFPGRGGNFELCPQTCPIRRGIPFGDPNVEGDYFPMPEADLPEESRRSRSRSGPLMNLTGPALNRTQPVGAGTLPPALDRSRLMNRTGPGGELNRTRPAGGAPCGAAVDVARPIGACSGAPNRTRPGPSGGLNQTRPRVGSSPNRTRPTAADLNRTRPILNTTGPVVSRNGSRINLNVTVELEPERQPLNTTIPVADALNRTRPMAGAQNRTRPMAEALNRTRPMTEALNRTRPMADALNRARPMAGAVNRTRPMPINAPPLQTPNNPPPQRRGLRSNRQQRGSCKPCYQVVTKKRFG